MREKATNIHHVDRTISNALIAARHELGMNNHEFFGHLFRIAETDFIPTPNDGRSIHAKRLKAAKKQYEEATHNLLGFYSGGPKEEP